MAEAFHLANGRVMTRLDALKQAAEFFFLQKAAADRRTQVCVIGFGGEAELLLDWTPLQRLDAVVRLIRSLKAGCPATNVAAALSLALDRIGAADVPVFAVPRPKVLLATDGAANVDTDRHDPLIRRACDQRVQLHTVAICNRSDNPTTYDRGLLVRMARETRGRFHTAHSLDQLKQVLCGVR
jgi:Mg-chelatase subunit ChlD